MTAGQCIQRFDGITYNTYSEEEKLEWLARLDARLQEEVIGQHECPELRFGEGLDRELTVGEPWEELYLRWLEAQVSYANGEFDLYNSAMAMFQAVYDSYRAWYTRTHMPRQMGRRFLF